MKIYLPIYLLMYLFIAFVLPSYRTYKATGVNPITFGDSDTAHDYIGFVMKLLIAMLCIAVIIYTFADDIYPFLVPISYLENNVLKAIGLILAHISLLWICVAQYQMRHSWRIGIDEVNKTDLVTSGIFGISRNPIFLGMIVSVLGIFLIIPNVLTFCIAITTYIVIGIQIRMEEAFLLTQHQGTYLQYKTNTNRFL